MTREEAFKKAINIVAYYEAHFAKSKEAREDAANIIEVLEQEPCEDAISRQAVLDKKELVELEDGQSFYCISPDDVETLPSVTPQLTASVLANMLMEERIKGTLDSDTTFEKDIIRDVKCKLTVSIRDHRPCYCGAELREVWREQESEE